MQPPFFFDSGFILTWLRMAWGWLRGTFFAPEQIVYTAMQMPALIGTGFTAWWIHDFARPWRARRIRASAARLGEPYPVVLVIAAPTSGRRM